MSPHPHSCTSLQKMDVQKMDGLPPTKGNVCSSQTSCIQAHIHLGCISYYFSCLDFSPNLVLQICNSLNLSHPYFQQVSDLPPSGPQRTQSVAKLHTPITTYREVPTKHHKATQGHISIGVRWGQLHPSALLSPHSCRCQRDPLQTGLSWSFTECPGLHERPEQSAAADPASTTNSLSACPGVDLALISLQLLLVIPN